MSFLENIYMELPNKILKYISSKNSFIVAFNFRNEYRLSTYTNK